MANLSLVQTFGKKFSSQIPDEEKDNVFRKYEFLGRFKLYPQTPETRAELKKVQEDEGLCGFLEKVMTDCSVVSPSDTKLNGEDGAEMTCMEWVKQHVICQQDATMAFWEVVNKGAEEKNSKKSRGR